MTNKKIKIGLDFHGVITDNPEYFSRFSQAAILRGYEIHIISGGPAAVVEKRLAEWNVVYTKIFAILDFYDLLGQVKFLSNGKFEIDPKLWDTAKARYCVEHQIDFHIDDTAEYAKSFSTPFCCYDQKQKDCCADGHLQLDLSKNPATALDAIAAIAAQRAAN